MVTAARPQTWSRPLVAAARSPDLFDRTICLLDSANAGEPEAQDAFGGAAG